MSFVTFADLHKILDNDDSRISLLELYKLLDGMRNDCLDMEHKLFLTDDIRRAEWYCGEENAFRLCLELLNHLAVCDLTIPEHQRVIIAVFSRLGGDYK